MLRALQLVVGFSVILAIVAVGASVVLDQIDAYRWRKAKRSA